MPKLSPHARQYSAAWLLLALLVITGLWANRQPGSVQGAGSAQQSTDYPVLDTPTDLPTTEGYPPPLGEATATIETLPTNILSVTPSLTGAPNRFLTENAQMSNSLTTPAGEQTFSPTRTATFTPTPSATPQLEATITPTPTAPGMVIPPIIWGVAGAVAPFVILSFTFLGIHLARAVKTVA